MMKEKLEKLKMMVCVPAMPPGKGFGREDELVEEVLQREVLSGQIELIAALPVREELVRIPVQFGCGMAPGQAKKPRELLPPEELVRS
ncbi:MAG: hypothetical protein ABH829_05390 [archaeon]